MATLVVPLTELREFIGLSDADVEHDALLESLEGEIASMIHSLCDRWFGVGREIVQEYLIQCDEQDWLTLTQIPLSITALEQRRGGAWVDVVTDVGTDIEIVDERLYLSNGYLLRGRARITYQEGVATLYTAVPPDIRLLIKQAVSSSFNKRVQATSRSESVVEFSAPTGLFTGFGPAADKILNRYRSLMGT